jgi:site-specific recombinase XerD
LLLGNEYTDTGYVHVKDNGKQYYPDVITKQLKRFLARNYLAPINLHELRHTYCTMLIAAGVDAKTVQYLMGHKAAIDRIDGVRYLSPHSCRHTYVSQLQALGVDMETIKR